MSDINWKERALGLQTRLDRLRLGVFDKDLLRRSLPLRAQVAARRAAATDARDRERRFGELSPAYVGASMDDLPALAGNMRQTTIQGLPWWVPVPRPDDSVYAEHALRQLDFPYRAIAQTRELAIGGVMLDVGANIGRMSIPRVMLGDAIVAYCAEPDPVNYACLVRNISDNGLRGLVLPDRVAVGMATGIAQLQRRRFAGGHRVIEAGALAEAGPPAEAATTAVQVVSLDDWVARLGVHPDQVSLVKVDVQGAELRVLRGASHVLAHRHIPWQIEIDPRLLQIGGSSVADLIGLLQSSFTDFVHLDRHATGPRVRPMADLADLFARPDPAGENHTDILACNLAPRADS